MVLEDKDAQHFQDFWEGETLAIALTKTTEPERSTHTTRPYRLKGDRPRIKVVRPDLYHFREGCDLPDTLVSRSPPHRRHMPGRVVRAGLYTPSFGSQPTQH